MSSVVEKVDAAAASRELVSEVRAILGALKGPRSRMTITSWTVAGDDLAVGISILFAAAGTISSGATKLSLVYTGERPTFEQAHSICAEMADASRKLEEARLVTRASGCGGALADLVDAAVRRLLMSVESLGVAVEEEDEQSRRSKTGVVWECAKSLQKLPKTNRSAYRRKLLGVASELRDQLAEFNEMLQQAAPDEAETDTESGDDDDDDFFGFGADEKCYSGPAEKKAARRCLACLEVVGLAYKTSMAAMDDRGGKEAAQATIQGLYELDLSVNKSATALAEGLYPPLESDELQATLTSLDATLIALDADLSPAALLPPVDLLPQWRTRLAAAREAIASLQSPDYSS